MAKFYKYPVTKRTLSAPFAGKKMAHQGKTNATVATPTLTAGTR